MKPARIVVIVVAAVAAVGLAMVVRMMGSGEPTTRAVAEAPVETPTVRVLVARRDLRIGDRIEDGDLVWRDWPEATVNAAYITDGAVAREDEADAEEPEGEAAEVTARVVRAASDLTGNDARAELIGSVVREAILEGEPIVARKIVRAGQSGYLAVVLAPGQRAMAVSVSAETGAGGFILPGDRVDVIMSRAADEEIDGNSGYVTTTVLRNIRVLAMGEVTEPEDDEQRVAASTATLEVGPREAELLAFAEAQGDLSLVLRSYADAGEPSGAAVPYGGAANAGPTGVRVFRNGEAELVPVS